ncbi:MAG: mandelate racemase/muconate lactonizing enzyme family protein [Halobacteriaceae archaeon]
MEITNVTGVVVEGNFDWPLIRVDTDEGVSGYGEVRDHGRGFGHTETHYVDDMLDLALDLEPVLEGRDPTNVAGVFEAVRSRGGWGRLGGGVSAVEMACWDVAGKHLDAPAWKLLGGKYRDEVRVYCDCRAGNPVSDSAVDYGLAENDYSPAAYADHAEEVEGMGFDFLKFDLDPNALAYVTGEEGVRGDSLTRAGREYLVDVVEALREALSPDTDVGFDCASMRSLPVDDVVRFGRAVDRYDVAALEDLQPDADVTGWKEITERIDTPTITGEDLYAREGFRELVRRDAVDMVGPDLLTAGGIRETVRIGEFAGAHGMPTNLHFAASPVGFAASVHAAAAIEDLLALEFHAVGVPWWDELVEEDLFADGYAPVPERPGLGVTPDEDAIREHARDPERAEGFVR